MPRGDTPVDGVLLTPLRDAVEERGDDESQVVLALTPRDAERADAGEWIDAVVRDSGKV